MKSNPSGGSHKNIWHGLGRQRIEIPKPVLKSRIFNNPWLKQLYICSLGYYPKAEGHYTYRKKGLPENFLFYCVDGSGWYKIGDKQYDVGVNEYFILPKNVEHAYGSSETNPWSIYWIHFGGDMLSFFNEMNVVKECFKPTYIKNNSEIFSVFSKIYKTLQMGYSTDNLIFANMCLSHFISQFIYSSKQAIDPTPSEKTDCVESAITYMQKHIDGNISLDELSKVNNYSTSRFSNLFKQKTGYAPIDYFIQMKMQKACQQLDFSDKSIKDVAYTLGFDDPYYFSRRFRKIIGISPNKYRAIKKD